MNRDQSEAKSAQEIPSSLPFSGVSMMLNAILREQGVDAAIGAILSGRVGHSLASQGKDRNGGEG